MLHKKWKREKIVSIKDEEIRTDVEYTQGKRAEAMKSVQERKKVRDVKIEKNKMACMKKMLSKQAIQRRNREIMIE